MTAVPRHATIFSAALLLGTVLGAAQANTALVDAAAYPEDPCGMTASCCLSNTPDRE